MPEMHPKIVFWGFMVEKFGTLMLRPPMKSIPSETRHLVQKMTAICLSVCSVELGKKSPKNKKIKNYAIKSLNIIFHPFTGGSVLCRLL